MAKFASEGVGNRKKGKGDISPTGLLAPIGQDELQVVFDGRYRGKTLGWRPELHRRFGYYNPDVHYEALVRRFVTAKTRWLDVGCGRELFVSNRPLATALSKRAALLVGVDPDETIEENPYVHQRVRGFVEDVPETMRFDLVTLRMVAEHVREPRELLKALSGRVVTGGVVVVYTVYRWSPVPIFTALTPFRLHQPIKSLLWRTDAKDTFPTVYAMNTRGQLRELFRVAGFRETLFQYLDDCRTFQRFKLGAWLEVMTWSTLKRLGLPYPERCLLSVYRKEA